MHPLYFFICLLASMAITIALILLAVFPIKLPLVPKEPTSSQPTLDKPKRARSPTHYRPITSYWENWEDDDEDL